MTTSPAPFVGRFGYPHVNVGILAPQEKVEDVWRYDAPRHWARHTYKIPDIINFRQQLINSHYNTPIKNQKGRPESSRLFDQTQEIGLSRKPVDVELSLTKLPQFKTEYSEYTPPLGARSPLQNLRIVENSKIPTSVQKAFDDNDLKANSAIISLYKKGFDENYLSRTLSVASFGMKYDRKLVPTRWSITATDDTISQALVEDCKKFVHRTDFSAYFGHYLGNYYLLLFFPEIWSYELFEMVVGENAQKFEGQLWTDYESYKGRTSYASNCTGGYYTVKLAIAEKLKEMRKLGSCLAFRFTTDEYYTPLGVWVTREAAREATKQKPVFFSSKELLLQYAKALAKRKFNVDLNTYLEKSKLLQEQKNQSRLKEFF